MALLITPPLDEQPWPTLGPDVCDWIEANLVYGPGPLRGQPYVIEPEFRAEIFRMFEIFPRGHARQGRRRFKRVALSKRKGTAKTEKAAMIVAAEAHPGAPVRCDGWRRQGSVWVPVGRGVRDPYIPMFAFTEEQSEDLAYGVLRAVLAESAIGDDFDIGLDRILVLDERGREAGKITALAGSPNARDGARTSFSHFDETHRMYSVRLKKAHTTSQQNLFKRVDADAWSLETTTAGELGEGSIAQDTHEYAELIAAGKVSDPQLFYVHRFAPDEMPMETVDQVRAVLAEATGPATWSGDIEPLVAHWFEPKCDRAYYRRVWANQWVKGGLKAFDPKQWARLAAGHELDVIAEGSLVTLGFDGARRRDSTGLVATDVETGFQQVVNLWDRPVDADDDWEVSAADVDLAVEAAFARWNVWRLYCDPPYWDEWVDAWEGRYAGRVQRWWTNRPKPMAHALRAFQQAIEDGTLSHNGDPRYAAHVAHAVRETIHVRTDTDEPLWIVKKERPHSPLKIDLVMAGCLSWEARGDAIAAGATAPPPPKRDRTMRTR
jgi:phage terminase large subunit-like protein